MRPSGEKEMLIYRNWNTGSFKCRMCKICFSNPNELRNHSMVKHKGHMLLPVKV